MAAKREILAVDLGASGGRVILGRFDAERGRLTIEEVHKFANGPQAVNGSLYWDILFLYDQVKLGIRRAWQAGYRPTSIGIDTWGVDYGLLDKNDQLINNPYHYRDRRTNGLLAEIFEIISREKIYEATGIQFLDLNTLVQLAADRKYRPWALDSARALLFIPDLLNFFFTGEKRSEMTIASTSQLLDTRNRRWAEELFATLDLPLEMMQPLVRPATPLGAICPGVRQEIGITDDVSVVAVGSHDTASAVAAVPFVDRERNVFLSSGTWSLLGMELSRPLINRDSLEANFTNECGLADTIRFLKNISGLWLIQECRRSWQRDRGPISYAEITEAAKQATPSLFELNPDHPCFVNPDDMPTAIRQYCQETGQYVPQNIGEMARGIYESLAKSYRRVLADLEAVVGSPVDRIHMVGGGVRAEILCQFTADITRRPVTAGPVEATAVGNMLAQLIACGEIRDLAEGREIVRSSFALEEYTPV